MGFLKQRVGNGRDRRSKDTEKRERGQVVHWMRALPDCANRSVFRCLSFPGTLKRVLKHLHALVNPTTPSKATLEAQIRTNRLGFTKLTHPTAPKRCAALTTRAASPPPPCSSCTCLPKRKAGRAIRTTPKKLNTVPILVFWITLREFSGNTHDWRAFAST